MAGRKPETFTKPENEALRVALKGYREKHRLSQAKMGKLVEVGQQAVATWEKGGGFSRQAAELLAVILGFPDANALIREAGATPNPMTVPQGWRDRELAVSIARAKFGYEEEVIRRVVVKYQEDHYKSRDAKWWNARFVNEDAEMQASRSAAPPAMPADAPRVEKKGEKTAKEPKRRRHAS